MTRIIRILALTGLISMATTAQAGGLLPGGQFHGTGEWTGPYNDVTVYGPPREIRAGFKIGF